MSQQLRCLRLNVDFDFPEEAINSKSCRDGLARETSIAKDILCFFFARYLSTCICISILRCRCQYMEWDGNSVVCKTATVETLKFIVFKSLDVSIESEP